MHCSPIIGALALCLALSVAPMAQGQVPVDYLPLGAIQRAVAAFYNVKPSNDSSAFTCGTLGETGNTTVFFSLLEPQTSNGLLMGSFNVAFWTACGESNFLQNTFISAYQPPQWRASEWPSAMAVFPAVPGGNALFGRATVLLCPKEGEEMNHIFKYELQRVGGARNGWDYGVFTFYYYDAAFC